MPASAFVAHQADAYLAGLAHHHDFRGSVLIARDGHILLHKGYGSANTAFHVSNSPHTRFRIGSLTKQFTALATLQLQTEGRLAVQDRICSHLNPCPASWRQITIQELLTHTSGIPDYTTLPSYVSAEGRYLTPAQLIALFRDKPLEFRPGTRWRYSNSGYALLGYIIAQVSGEPYGQYVTTHILRPLHLLETGYDVNHPSLRTHATGYASWAKQADFIDMSVPYAAGALYSSVDDLYRWDQDLLATRPPIISWEMVRQLFTPYALLDPAQPHKSASYGYGWFIEDFKGHPMIDHGGDINGFVSFNGFFPRDRVTIVVLSNLVQEG